MVKLQKFKIFGGCIANIETLEVKLKITPNFEWVKCNFPLRETPLHSKTRNFLGHVISHKGIEVDKVKVDLISNPSSLLEETWT